jgi:hypothetical protein
MHDQRFRHSVTTVRYFVISCHASHLSCEIASDSPDNLGYNIEVCRLHSFCKLIILLIMTISVSLIVEYSKIRPNQEF